MIRNTLRIFVLMISPVLFAQLPPSLITPVEETPDFRDYSGSVYKTLAYKKASLINEELGTFKTKLRYNIYTDAIQCKKDSKTYQLIKNKTTHARINEDYFYYCEFRNQRDVNRPGYYVLIELTDNYRIYKKYTIDIQPPQKRIIIGAADSQGQLSLETTYYLEQDDVIMELPMNKKKMLEALSDKKDELSRYIKEKRINIRKEEDLKHLVSRYNALKATDSNPSTNLLTNTGKRN